MLILFASQGYRHPGLCRWSLANSEWHCHAEVRPGMHIAAEEEDAAYALCPSERPEHYLAEVPHPLGVVGVITVGARFLTIQVCRADS